MKALIVQCLRKSLIAPQERFLRNIGVDFDKIQIGKAGPVELKKKADRAATGKYRRVMITNGSDSRDKDFVRALKKIKPTQRMLYCEKGWLPYSKFMFFDAKGFGNHTDLFSWEPDKFPAATPSLYNRIKKIVLGEMARGKPVPHKDFVFAPLQVDNDSKMWIGSPHFPKVRDFVDYLIGVVPDDVMILFRNHPHNKKPVKIPKRRNVRNITKAPFSKASLVNKSIFVAGINTTFLLESLLCGVEVVSYGLDVFSNKGLVCDGYGKSWEELLEFRPNNGLGKRFLCELMRRQAYRLPRPDIVTQHCNCHWAKHF